MYRTKSRRNIRSKRNLSRKNRSRKNRNNRRMKGGLPSSYIEAIRLNSITLCGYQKLLNKHREGIIDEKSLKERAAELMLYQIKKNDLNAGEYTNPMRIAQVMSSGIDVWSNYVDTRVDCHGTVM